MWGIKERMNFFVIPWIQGPTVSQELFEGGKAKGMIHLRYDNKHNLQITDLFHSSFENFKIHWVILE